MTIEDNAIGGNTRIEGDTIVGGTMDIGNNTTINGDLNISGDVSMKDISVSSGGSIPTIQTVQLIILMMR